MILRAAHRGLSADPAELLSITERSRYLSGLRLGLAGVVTFIVLASDSEAAVAVSTATAAFLALSFLVAAIVRGGGRAAVPVLQGSLLVDGLYLATVIAQTGGAAEAIQLMPYVHVVRRDAALFLPDRAEARPVAHAAVAPGDRGRSIRCPARTDGGGHRGERGGRGNAHHRRVVGVRSRHRAVRGRERAPTP